MAGHVNNHVSDKTEMYAFLFHVKEFGGGGGHLGLVWVLHGQ